jgi:NAD+ synthase (glutamine-hydrolysing)
MLKVALAQINATVGDLEGNSQLIEAAAREAYAKGARLVVSPVLSRT